ncbi:hypothetical protein DesfrDRAFT_1843 [Solidesulfovibrio fructosivorans JJ]]|uniref:DUF2867 domain-containing protein n=1 Tax=Solidesulfovibrio fructosivorans JJ] TaxID=596151 RepID=E1JW44_SOLFR|nr:DUF2867 domain-containing protein [Solidesulfovibrio fructosivorans]EFL51404.1 hypothetical protein DesfrDRAFT_1843 [Solidesulfovibrio fructosivorans JJ]]
MDARSEALDRLERLGALSATNGRKPDHVDIHRVRGAIGLRPFVAGLLGRRPGWLRLLYRARAVLARLLGLQQAEGLLADVSPADVPMQPGGRLSVFTVVAADADSHWVAVGEDKHLRAVLAVLATPEPDGRNRFDLVTVVDYLHWTGPVYFNLIRPFHHLVVWRQAQNAAKG